MPVLDVIDDKVMYCKTLRPTDMQNQVTEIFNQVTNVTCLQNLKAFLGKMSTNAQQSASYWPWLLVHKNFME